MSATATLTRPATEMTLGERLTSDVIAHGCPVCGKSHRATAKVLAGHVSTMIKAGYMRFSIATGDWDVVRTPATRTPSEIMADTRAEWDAVREAAKAKAEANAVGDAKAEAKAAKAEAEAKAKGRAEAKAAKDAAKAEAEAKAKARAEAKAAKDAAKAALLPTAEEAAEIAESETALADAIGMGAEAAMNAAVQIVRLYDLRAWRGHTAKNGQVMGVKSYYESRGIGENDGFTLPSKARLYVVETMGNRVEIETIVAMTGASTRSVNRDRANLGLTNPARTGRNGSGGRTATPTDTSIGSDAPTVNDATSDVTGGVYSVAMNGKYVQVTGLLDLVGMLTTVQDLQDVITLCQERIAEIKAEAAAA